MAFYSVQSQLPSVVFTRRSKDGSYLSNWNLKRYNEYLKAKGKAMSSIYFGGHFTKVFPPSLLPHFTIYSASGDYILRFFPPSI